jgi:hypothetical protein
MDNEITSAEFGNVLRAIYEFTVAHDVKKPIAPKRTTTLYGKPALTITCNDDEFHENLRELEDMLRYGGFEVGRYGTCIDGETVTSLELTKEQGC